MLYNHKSYVQAFKTEIESVSPDVSDFKIVIHADKISVGEHRVRYNAPTTSEVAVVKNFTEEILYCVAEITTLEKYLKSQIL
ncbi:hypothetical protein HNY73_004994 [Argiope bruennichi]|uniref:Uncharacterized protein n=1 Tax=Argiope bruennichi TaxID=94029 RepID=A0A8T0FT94_ARGBR|nr:hypothetical protein HNY73_004994 [Argiope bruennichi]